MTSPSSPPIDLNRLTAAEFARMSRSLQLTFLVIRRAQVVSRRVIAATPNWSERYGSRLGSPQTKTPPASPWSPIRSTDRGV